MQITLIGRTNTLLDIAKYLYESGIEIPIIITTDPADYDQESGDKFKIFAKKIKSKFISTAKLDDKQIINIILQSKCNLAVSMNWPTLIKKSFIDLFPKGIINIHPGDLPKYRGNATVNWAILNDEKRIGLTLHLMNEKLDEGPIVNKIFFNTNKNTYVGEVYDWIKNKAPNLVLQSIINLNNNSISLLNQKDTKIKSLRCYPRKPEDSQIVWGKSNIEIHKLIRASSKPFLGAYSFISSNNKKIIIWKADIVYNNCNYLAVPGQVCYVENNYPIIATGKGLIKIINAEIENKSNEDSIKLIYSSLRNRLIFKYNY